MTQRALVIMARAPIRGTVKTRLAATLGDDAALAVYRRLGALAAHAAREVADCVRVVTFTPASGEAVTREWLGTEFAYEPQASGDLGQRMAAAVAGRWAAGCANVVVIGTDCPTLDAQTMRQAFGILEAGASVVVGPAEDGGYYLIGVSRPSALANGRDEDSILDMLFDGVPWSSPDTLSVTLARTRVHGVNVVALATMRDVDDKLMSGE